MRLMFVTDEWRPYIGGAGLCMELFAHELTALGYEIVVATAWHPEAPTHERLGGIDVHRIRDLPSRARWISESETRHTPPPFVDPEATWRLRRLIRDFDPELVSAYGWIAHSAAAALIGRRTPMVLWQHDYANVCAMRNLLQHERTICSGPAPAKCLSCSVDGRGVAKGTVAAASVLGIGPLLRRKVSAVHSVSRFVAEVTDRDLHIPGVSSAVIHNFHQEGERQAADEEILARLPQEPFILFVGALRRVKGVPELLAAYERLEDPPPLVLVGIRTPDTPPFPAGVTVLHDVPHATVMAMWQRALYGVFPSTWPEPLATVVHEAMSEGRPVIATRVGGHPDMVDDGATGILVEPGDVGELAAALRTLNEDPELRDRLGAAARERARQFTREVAVPELDRLLRAAAAPGRSEAA